MQYANHNMPHGTHLETKMFKVHKYTFHVNLNCQCVITEMFMIVLGKDKDC